MRLIVRPAGLEAGDTAGLETCGTSVGLTKVSLNLTRIDLGIGGTGAVVSTVREPSPLSPELVTGRGQGIRYSGVVFDRCKNAVCTVCIRRMSAAPQRLKIRVKQSGGLPG